MKKYFLWSFLAMMAITLVSVSLSACDKEESDENSHKSQGSGENQGSGGEGEQPTYTNTLQFFPNMTADYLSLYDATASIKLSGNTETVTIQEGMKIERSYPKGQAASITIQSTPKPGIDANIDKTKTYSISRYTGITFSIICTDEKGNILKQQEHAPESSDHLSCSGLDIICNLNYYAYNISYSFSETQINVLNNNSTTHEQAVDITSGDAIDLGLNVLWASANVKAPTGYNYYGTSYYAWGETQIKNDYTWETYKFHANGHITKYTPSDGLARLELSDDVANVVMGGNWRMPTKEEMADLSTKCTWTWVTYKGLKGYRVEGTNGNSIFLPACGHLAHNTIQLYGFPLGANKEATYWTSEVLTTTGEYPYQAGAVLAFDKDGRSLDELNARMGGAAVRAVCPK